MRNNLVTDTRSEIPTKLSEAREFLLQNALEDGQMYANQDLLSGWTTSLLGETWLRIIKSSEREASWEERAPLHRKRNILLGIQGALKNENDRVSRDGSSIFTTRNR
jgi:photosystem II stability/assembly factor-like uncharacterized protein